MQLKIIGQAIMKYLNLNGLSLDMIVENIVRPSTMQHLVWMFK